MASDVQRLYFEHPNVYVWNQDLAQIHDAEPEYDSRGLVDGLG